MENTWKKFLENVMEKNLRFWSSEKKSCGKQQGKYTDNFPGSKITVVAEDCAKLPGDERSVHLKYNIKER